MASHRVAISILLDPESEARIQSISASAVIPAAHADDPHGKAACLVDASFHDISHWGRQLELGVLIGWCRAGAAGGEARGLQGQARRRWASHIAVSRLLSRSSPTSPSPEHRRECGRQMRVSLNPENKKTRLPWTAEQKLIFIVRDRSASSAYANGSSATGSSTGKPR